MVGKQNSMPLFRTCNIQLRPRPISIHISIFNLNVFIFFPNIAYGEHRKIHTGVDCVLTYFDKKKNLFKSHLQFCVHIITSINTLH